MILQKKERDAILKEKMDLIKNNEHDFEYQEKMQMLIDVKYENINYVKILNKKDTEIGHLNQKIYDLQKSIDLNAEKNRKYQKEAMVDRSENKNFRVLLDQLNLKIESLGDKLKA